MKVRKISFSEILHWSNNELEMWNMCSRIGAWRLLGFDYEKYVRWYQDDRNMQYVFEYE